MNAKKAVREIMAQTGTTLTVLASRCGKHIRVISDRLGDKSDTITVSKLDEMLRAMDYKIVLMPRDVRMKEGWFEAE